MTRWLRPRTRLGRFLLAAAALAIGAAIGASIRQAARPVVYYVSHASLRNYRAQHVPDVVVDRLLEIAGKVAPTRQAVLDDVRRQVGDGDYRTHEQTFAKFLNTKPCWPNASPLRVHVPADSRAHPAYGRFGAETVVPSPQLPAVPTQFDFLPAGEGVLVLGKLGGLNWLGQDFRPRLAVQLPDVYPGGDDEGALGLAVDPGFASNRFIYVSHVDGAGTGDVIVRLTLLGEAAAILKSRVEILRFAKDNRENFHGIAGMRFDRAGVLQVQVGDPTDHSQQWGDYQGKLLGIVPGRGPGGGYELPPATLWQRLRGVFRFGSPLILADGLRAPFSSTQWRDYLIMGDVGGNGPWSQEEIDVYRAPGQNFGWGVCEQPLLHADFDPPAIAFRRGDPGVDADDALSNQTDRRSVIVGVVYDGAAADRYAGLLERRLLYADFFLGFLRGARLSGTAQVEDDVFLMHLPFLTSMRIGPDGSIYGVTALGTQGLFRLILMPQRR